MKLVTRFELASKNENELYVLLRESFNELVKSGHSRFSLHHTASQLPIMPSSRKWI